ncbi:MAG: PEGA domain-containing protein [Myxococcales bacterium]|nr:PEGA domain-containing protein [Polyangiaceae bacterium]MDW8249469.1 PEGA domain-containing protein [Myxococcales bacterium]
MQPRLLRAWLTLLLLPTLTLGKEDKDSKPKPNSVPVSSSAGPLSSALLGNEAVRKEEARLHFERGIALSDEESWNAALVEFARSRELFPTRGNTKNLALTLRKLQRFDEALDVYEQLLREFTNLSPQDRAFVDKELDELRKRVGTLEISTEAGATVTVGNRNRGIAPTGALRVSAGSHLVRVFKEGFLPFEERIDVLGGQSVKVEAKLSPLVQSGRLRVVEQGGLQVDVEIDNNVVGKTPWEGPVSPGEHTVRLRGEGNLGTPPAQVPVKLNETATITLAVESLDSELRVEPQPSNATVAIDGISVGRGLWSGRLRAGDHLIEVGAEGFLPERRKISLRKDASETAVVVLERDPNSPLWRRLEPSRFLIGVRAFGVLGTTMGGEVTESCTEGCSSGLPVGGGVMLRGGYQLGSGLGFGVEIGYLGVRQQIEQRPEALRPVGLPENPGRANDTLLLQGLNAGATAWFRRGKPWGWAVQLSAGVLLGTLRDARIGDFTTITSKVAGGAGLPYSVGPVVETSPARYLYVSPEARLTYRFLPRAELGFGVQVMVLSALLQPRWQDKRPLLTGSCGGQAAGCVTDGQARFGEKTTGSQVFPLVSPGASLRYEF